jgi:DNA-binding CsgD family transcriptional regulator
MTRADMAQQVANDVYDQWALNPQRAAVLPAMRAVAVRVEQLRDPNRTVLYRALTAAQTRTLEQVVAGLPNAEIGVVLGIAEDTVKSHVRSVLHKLGAKNRAHAVVRAHQLGLVDLGGVG